MKIRLNLIWRRFAFDDGGNGNDLINRFGSGNYRGRLLGHGYQGKRGRGEPIMISITAGASTSLSVRHAYYRTRKAFRTIWLLFVFKTKKYTPLLFIGFQSME
jgi:hypothetical protein